MKDAAGKHPVLTDRHITVSPELLGLPLASRWRRALAFGIDYLLLLLPTLIVSLSAALLSIWATDPAALRAMSVLVRGGEAHGTAEREALKELAPLLTRLEAPGLPAEAAAAVERGDLDRAADVLQGCQLLFSLAIGEHGVESLGPKVVRVPIERMIPRYARAAALYGIAALYFTLLTRSRRGSTFGKRLFKIRVVSLGGERLGLLESFERFAAYLEIPATLGFCLINLWRDPNRRLPHDRLANTVVLKDPGEREPRPAPAEDAGSPEQEPPPPSDPT
jgi:uncharacterized RDD family membrane protein YckC